MELQVVGGDGRVLAAARVNLAEYVAAKDYLNLRSQLRSSQPDAPPLVVKFRLRCSVVKVTPARTPPSTAASTGELGALGRRVAAPDSPGNVSLNTTVHSPAANQSVSSLNQSNVSLNQSGAQSPASRSNVSANRSTASLNQSAEEEEARLDNTRLRAALEAQGAELEQLSEQLEESAADNSRLKSALEVQSAEFNSQLAALQQKVAESTRRATESERLVEARIAKVRMVLSWRFI